MKEMIYELEQCFFFSKYMNDENWLNQHIHEEFLECGKSGLLFRKEETINSLLEMKEDRAITIFNFTCDKIDADTYLVHYISMIDMKQYFRTSIWVQKEVLKLRYHQASLLLVEEK